MLIKEHDVESGQVVEREMTADELAQWEADSLASKERAEAEAKSKAALLDRLGITEAEAKLLLS